MPATVRVRFAGTGAGVGELTWGQRLFWLGIQRTGRSATMGGSTLMPPDITVGIIAESLTTMMTRHPSLRTRFRFEPDGSVRQQCFDSGAIELLVIDAPPDDPAAAQRLADECAFAFLDKDFDYQDEWPIRVAVVIDGDAVRHYVAVYLHTALDAGGIAAILRDDLSRPPPGPTPLELAGRQQAPAGRRTSDLALKHHEAVLRGMRPADFTPALPLERQPQLFQFRSPALALAIPAISQRNQVNGAVAMFAMFVAGLARFDANPRPTIALMVSNRFRPGLAEAVTALVQDSLLTIDTTGLTLAELVQRCRGELLTAFKSAYYDPAERHRLVERLSRELWAVPGRPPPQLQPWCLYNDRCTWLAPPAAVTKDELDAALTRSTRQRLPEAAPPDRRIFLHVDESPADAHRPAAIELMLSADSRWYDEAQSRALPGLIEQAAIETALCPDRVVRPAQSTGTGPAFSPADHFSSIRP